MFHTLTLNPSLDVFHEVPRLPPGRVVRTGEPRIVAGGKGINVARRLCELAGPGSVVAHCLAGGHTGARLLDILAAEGIPVNATRFPGEMRENLHLRVSPSGREFKINPAGPRVPPRALTACVRNFTAALRPGDVAVICGSPPPGVSGAALGRIVRNSRARGASVWVDMEGGALREALRAAPFGLKPNREEFRELTGVDPSSASRRRVLEAARKVLAGSRAQEMLLSLGSRGAVWISAGAEAWAEPPRIAPTRHAVGAGDALLAAWLHHGRQGLSPSSALRRAVDFASRRLA